jgi:hypothetical protein
MNGKYAALGTLGRSIGISIDEIQKRPTAE